MAFYCLCSLAPCLIQQPQWGLSAFCLWAVVHHAQQRDYCSLLRMVRLRSLPHHHTQFTVNKARKGEWLLPWNYPVCCLQGGIIFTLPSINNKLHHHLIAIFLNIAVPKPSMNWDVNNILAMTEIFALYSAVGVSLQLQHSATTLRAEFLFASLQILWTLLNHTLNTLMGEPKPLNQKGVKETEKCWADVWRRQAARALLFSEKSRVWHLSMQGLMQLGTGRRQPRRSPE